MLNKIYIKAIGIIIAVILVYSITIIFVLAPKMQTKFVQLEEENAKAQLDKVFLLVEQAAIELDMHHNKKEIKNKKIQLISQLRQILKNIKIGETGYLFIFNGNKQIVIHPNKDINNDILKKLINSYKNNNGILRYKDNKLSDQENYIYDKVSWVKYNKFFDWYICSSAYVDEMSKEAVTNKKTLVNVSLVLLIVSFIVGLVLIRKLLRPLYILTKQSQKVIDGNLDIQVDIKSNDEIGMLSKNFNNMVKTLKFYIDNLDDQVKEKTKELQELNKIADLKVKELKMQKDTFETLFEDNSDGLLLIQDQKFIACNKSIVKMLNYENKEQVLNIHPSQLSPEYQPDDQLSFDKANEMVKICIEKGYHEFEWVHRKANNVDFWVRVSLNTITIDNKLTIYVKWRDIDNEKRLEIENILKSEVLKKTQDQLIKSEKMVALSNMVAGVAHEINTPVGMALTGITHIQDEANNIKKLYDNEDMSQEEFEEYLEDSIHIHNSIYVNLVKAADLIKSFKQVAVDQSSDEDRTFNLQDYINEILTSIHNEIKKTKHQIEINIKDDIIIYSNPGAFSQIITNFIMNSIIHGLKDIDKGMISIDAQLKNNTLIFIYKDNGIGLSNEVKDKIFDPFYTTNRASGGSGLGMNIVYNIITQKLNGTIEVKSEPNEGVEFIATIPVKDK